MVDRVGFALTTHPMSMQFSTIELQPVIKK